jgi:dGTPase
MSIAASDRKHAPCATHPDASRGRKHEEAKSATRSPFQRDRDRIIHSAAFRRLKQKTQVFVAHESDQYRTRLTHSLEVSQIARTLARTLGGDEDLAEALALAHDLGHPPFGHEGERVLAHRMRAHGGFDHNAQSLRIVTRLEVRYPGFEGLNLSWETLEGIVKHNGPLLKPGDDGSHLPWAFTAYEDWAGLELDNYAGIEAQIAAVADDIAYNNHDIDDGLRSGILELEPLLELPLVGDVFRDVDKRWPDTPRPLMIHEAVRDLIGLMVDDVLSETSRRLAEDRPQSADAVRQMPRAMVAFSEPMIESLAALRRHLFAHLYRHKDVNRMMAKAGRVMGELFDHYLAQPQFLPSGADATGSADAEASKARSICDYIAGMTDRFAVEEHHRLIVTRR